MSNPSARLLIPVLSATNFAIGVGAFLVIGVLTPIATDLAMSEAEAGMIVTAYALAYAFGSPLLVSLTGSWPRRQLLSLALLVFAAAAALMAMAPDAETLIAGRVLAALSAGIVSPVAASVAAASAPPERRGRALAGAFVGLTLAQVIGVPGGAWIGYTYGWRADFWAVAALAVIVAGLVRVFVPASIQVEPGKLRALAETVRNGRAMLVLSFTPVFVAAAYVFYTFAAPVLEAGMGLGRDGVSLFLFVVGGGAVVGNLMTGRLVDRIGPVKTLTLQAVMTVLVLAVFSFLPIPFWALLVAGFLWSVFGWGFFAAQQIRLIATAPERATLLLSLNAASLYLGMSVGSAIGSALAGAAGLAWLGLAGAAVAVLALLDLLWSERLLAKGAAAR